MTQSPRVIAIYFSPKRGKVGDLTTQMQRRCKVRVLTGQGIEEDRYPRNGAYPDDGTRDLTLIAIEDIRAANEGYPEPERFAPEDTRRQIVTEGIDLATLRSKTFKLGSVWLKYARDCDPCDRPSKLAGKPGFKERFANRGGIRVLVLTNGEIAEGDSIGTIC